jgi:uncharacterized phage infection (PIP) family protein YhgE
VARPNQRESWSRRRSPTSSTAHSQGRLRWRASSRPARRASSWQLAQGINGLSESHPDRRWHQPGRGAVNASLQGDLTQKIEAEYQGIFGQLKDDTNTTIERLREVVGRIKDATEAINIASQEIAAGNQDLSSRTEEQASSLEETSSAMEELNATVKQNAENAKQANELAKTSNAGVTKGSQVVKDVVVTMGDIQASSKKISDIIGVSTASPSTNSTPRWKPHGRANRDASRWLPPK